MSFLLPIILSALVGIIVTFICIKLLRPIAIRIGLVDTPGGRKMHGHSVPLIGGIAIFMGFLFALLCLNISLQPYRGLLAGSGILILTGILDDFHELTPRIRLMGQCLAALLLIEWGHISIAHIGNLLTLGKIYLGFWSVSVTILFVLAFINAINMIDGHDGLAGLIVLGQVAMLSLFNFHFQQLPPAYLLVLMGVVLCVFLVFNFPLFQKKQADVFLGDAGSTFLGFFVAWFAIDLSQRMLLHPEHHFNYNPITLLWVLGYPLFDLVAVILNRISIGKSPLIGGRDHLHHRLFDLHIKPVIITALLFGFSIMLGLIGILLAVKGVSEFGQFMGFISAFAIYFMICFCWQRRSLTKQKINSIKP